MKESFIFLFFCLILSVGLHFLKIYLDKVLIRQKEKYQDFLKSVETHTKMEYNIEKTKIESLEVYNKWIGFFKWFIMLAGIFDIIRSAFPKYFE